jgi:hypothetical protein
LSRPEFNTYKGFTKRRDEASTTQPGRVISHTANYDPKRGVGQGTLQLERLGRLSPEATHPFGRFSQDRGTLEV